MDRSTWLLGNLVVGVIAIIAASFGFWCGACWQTEALHHAEMNEADARIDEVELLLFGGSSYEKPESINEIQVRLTTANLQLREHPPWRVAVPAKDIHGHPVEILVFPYPLEDGSYVINFHTEADDRRRDGRCWGTKLKPEPVE